MANFPDSLHERGQPLRRKFNCTGRGRPGAARRGRRLRGALRRDRGRERGRQRGRRTTPTRPCRPSAGRRVQRDDASRPAVTTRPTSALHARSLGRSSTTGSAARRTRRRRRRAAAARPPIARNSHVISLSPGSRPSREPRFSYAFSSASGGPRLRELAARRLGDRAQRVRIGWHGDELRLRPDPGCRRTARARSRLRACRARSCRRGSRPPSRAALPRAAAADRASARRRRGRGSTPGSSPRILAGWVACASDRVGRRAGARRSPSMPPRDEVCTWRRGRPRSAERRRSRFHRRRGTRRCP